MTPLLVLTTGREGAEAAANRRARRLLSFPCFFSLSLSQPLPRARVRSGGGSREGGSRRPANRSTLRAEVVAVDAYYY